MAEELEVLQANQRFYDRIAATYDQVDSRRAGQVDHSWLDPVLERAIQELKKSGRDPRGFEFVDAGAGSGFLAKRAQVFFERITLIDISQAMLDRVDLPGARKIQGSCEKLPLQDESVDFIGAFATLHHLFSPLEFFKEAARVLRKGGVLYCDHDIESHFVSRYSLPLKFYRYFFDHGEKYLAACPEAGRQDYEMSEFHGDSGLNGPELVRELKELGFRIAEESYHWDGMGPAARALGAVSLAKTRDVPGNSPVVRIIAVK